MTLYEINQELENLYNNIEVDEETGEVLVDTKAIEALSIARDEKIEGTACYIKSLKATIEAIKQEEKNLKSRKDVIEKKMNRLSDYLSFTLNGSKFESPKCKINFRKSTSTEVYNEEEFVKNNPDLVEYVITPKYSKTDIKKAIQSGKNIKGAMLVDNTNMTIK